MKKNCMIRKLVIWLIIIGVLMNFPITAFSAVPDSEMSTLDISPVEPDNEVTMSLYDMVDPCVNEIEVAYFDEDQTTLNSEDSGALNETQTQYNTTISTSTDFTESTINIDLETYNGLNDLDSDNTDTDFTNMFDSTVITVDSKTYQVYPFMTQDEVTSGKYANIQGSCYDGQYYYFAFLIKMSKSEVIDVRIVRATFNGTKFAYVSHISGLKETLQHANDMTYNSNTGEIIIACSQPLYHNRVYSIHRDDFNEETVPSDFECHYISCMVTSIDYNAVRNQYIVGVTAHLNYYVILDHDFNIITTIGYYSNVEDYDLRWARQTVSCDENYIYSLNWWNDPDNEDDTSKLPADVKNLLNGDTISNEVENRIVVFDWDGNYVKTIYFTTIKDSGYERAYEVESMIVANDKIFLMFNCVRNVADRQFCFYNLMNNSFLVEYCMDESAAKSNATTNNNTSFVIRGVSTKLHENRITNSEKKFVGWTAYRVTAQKWYYESADGLARGWYTEGTEPEGYTKYIYSNEQRVANTGAAGERVLMCAQWEDTNKFFVEFLPNGGSGTMTPMEVVHGTSTALTSNQFTKTDRSFEGWNAYWVEKNKWYYQSADGLARGWYQEGMQPEGYTKYEYADCQTVKQTAYAGGHIQMHAKWDEFYIYYNSGNAIIAQSKIKNMTTGKYPSSNTNQIIAYNEDDLHDTFSSYWESSVEFKWYHLYRQEIDKWYYESADGLARGWYTEGSEPEGYTKYVKELPNGVGYIGGTAYPGEHLVLYAVWAYYI